MLLRSGCGLSMTRLSSHILPLGATCCNSLYRKMSGEAFKMESVVETWRTCDAVSFDVDSTLCTTEMIDELAVYCNVGQQVAEWTRKAMGEGISFREALHARLNIIRPPRATLVQFGHTNTPLLTPGVKKLIAQLFHLNKHVYLVSGGFRSLIEPIASEVGVDLNNIFANRILFDAEGEYMGFDTDEPTSASGGKRVVMEELKQKHGYTRLVMIGDGMSDYEAYPVADLFIGFGGNVVRENVKKKAPWYVTDFNVLLQALD